MRIGRNIKGIRAFLERDAAHWHIFINGEYYEYTNWMGNNLIIEKRQNSEINE